MIHSKWAEVTINAEPNQRIKFLTRIKLYTSVHGKVEIMAIRSELTQNLIKTIINITACKTENGTNILKYQSLVLI